MAHTSALNAHLTSVGSVLPRSRLDARDQKEINWVSLSLLAFCWHDTHPVLFEVFSAEIVCNPSCANNVGVLHLRSFITVSIGPLRPKRRGLSFKLPYCSYLKLVIFWGRAGKRVEREVAQRTRSHYLNFLWIHPKASNYIHETSISINLYLYVYSSMT